MSDPLAHCRLMALAIAMVLCGIPIGCRDRSGENTSTVGVALPEAGVAIVGTDERHRTIAHPFGVTKVPLRPQRIVSLGMADPLILLGEKPVAHTLFFGTFRDYLRPHLEGVQSIGTVYGGFQPNIESIYAAKPDVIIASHFTGLSYAHLSRIAPTVIITPQRHPSDWRHALDELRQVAMVLGKAELAQRIESTFRAKAATARELLGSHPAARQTVATFRVHVRRYRMNGRPQGGGPILYDLLGLRPPEVIREHHWGKRAPMLFLTEEKLLHLDVDHLFVIVDPTPGSGRAMDRLARRAVWQRLNAVREGNVYEVSTGSWQGGGLLAQEQVLDDIVTHLTGHTIPKLLGGVSMP